MQNSATLCYVINRQNNQILFGEKKYGGAKGKINGFGGKIEVSDSSIKEAVIREVKEETGITIVDPELVSIVTISNRSSAKADKTLVKIYVYVAYQWIGVPQESSEMTVEWINAETIPFDRLWENDRLWFNAILSGHKSIIKIESLNDKVDSVNINFTETLHENIRDL